MLQGVFNHLNLREFFPLKLRKTQHGEMSRFRANFVQVDPSRRMIDVLEPPILQPYLVLAGIETIST